MTDLKNGIIDYQGVIVSKDTRASDFENLSHEDIEIEVSKRGDILVTALKPISSNGIDMRLEVFFSQRREVPTIELYPSIPKGMKDTEAQARYCLELSKKWLAGMMDIEPTSDGTDSVFYSFDWGYICSKCWKDRDYGIVGGDIEFKFKEV